MNSLTAALVAEGLVVLGILATVAYITRVWL
jgi:hypothetical protein